MPVAVRLHALVAAAVALAVAILLALGTADASARKTCDISGKQDKLGVTYVLKLKVQRVSCAKAERVVKAFHKCRHAHGKAGKCGHRVKGFKCTEHRFDKISTQYDSDVTCKDGSARVWHTYTQFT